MFCLAPQSEPSNHESFFFLIDATACVTQYVGIGGNWEDVVRWKNICSLSARQPRRLFVFKIHHLQKPSEYLITIFLMRNFSKANFPVEEILSRSGWLQWDSSKKLKTSGRTCNFKQNFCSTQNLTIWREQNKTFPFIICRWQNFFLSLEPSALETIF